MFCEKCLSRPWYILINGKGPQDVTFLNESAFGKLCIMRFEKFILVSVYKTLWNRIVCAICGKPIENNKCDRHENRYDYL